MSAEDGSDQLDRYAKGKRQTIPLDSPEPEAPDYPSDALPSLLRDMVEAVAEHVQCPMAIAGQSVLAAASLSVQGFADVLIDGRRHPASVFAMTIAASGERKTSADRLVLRPFEDWERRAWEAYHDEQNRYFQSLEQRKLEEAERKKRWKRKAGNVYEMAPRAEDLPEEIKAPEVPTLISSDATYQGLYRAFLTGRPSQGLFSDEGGTFLGGWGMKAENLAYTVSSLSRLWDGSPIRWTRGGDNATAPLYSRRLASHLLITPAVAERNLNDFMIGQGFLPRFLIARPASRMGFREYTNSDPTADPRITNFWTRMGAVLDEPIPRSDDGGCDLKTITLEPDARDLFISVYDRWEKKIRPEGDLFEVSAFVSKASENLARIAAVSALVENIAAATISLEHVAGAARLMDKFYLPEALRFIQMAPGNQELRDAQRLLVWLQEKRQGVSFKVRDVCREGPRCARKSATVARALLATLVDHNFVRTIGKEFMLND